MDSVQIGEWRHHFIETNFAQLVDDLLGDVTIYADRG
jgi:hypothetical protein